MSIEDPSDFGPLSPFPFNPFHSPHIKTFEWDLGLEAVAHDAVIYPHASARGPRLV
jgi:hypothetical protein